MTRNKIILLIIGVIVIVGAMVLNSSDQKREGKKRVEGPEPSQKAPDFSLKDYDGNVVSSANFAGKPMVINSWAVWCPFCVQELKDFAAVAEEFSAKGGQGRQVTIIAIDRAEPLKMVKEFTDDLGVTDRLVFLLDPSDSFYKNIGGFTMPETIFVDGEGKIVDHKRGPMDLDEMRDRISKLLISNY